MSLCKNRHVIIFVGLYFQGLFGPGGHSPGSNMVDHLRRKTLEYNQNVKQGKACIIGSVDFSTEKVKTITTFSRWE